MSVGRGTIDLRMLRQLEKRVKGRYRELRYRVGLISGFRGTVVNDYKNVL